VGRENKNGYGIETKYMFGAVQNHISTCPTIMSFVNGGRITAKEFFYAAHYSRFETTKFYVHETTRRFSDGLLSSIASGGDLTFVDKPGTPVSFPNCKLIQGPTATMLTGKYEAFEFTSTPLNIIPFSFKASRSASMGYGGARKGPQKLTKTAQKVVVGNRQCVVYEGRRGGRYVKQKGQFVPIKKSAA